MDTNRMMDKFNGSNFPTWQTKARLLLMKEGVWNVVKGIEKEPTLDQGAEKQRIWQDKNDKATALIGLGLADSLIHHVDFDKTAKEVWDKLENLFGNKINNSKVFLKQKFFSSKMKESDTLQEHLSTLGSIIQQLTALKAPPDDDDMKAVLLTSLEDVNKFSETLGVLRVAREMSFDEMVAILIDEDRRQEDLPTSHSFDKAFYGKDKGKGRTGKSVRCTYCKKLGHTENRCFKKMAAQQSKDHANLVAAEEEDEDEDKAETSTTTEDKALTVMTNLSLAEEDYDWAF